MGSKLSAKIEFPKDKDRQKQLQIKYQEYCARLARNPNELSTKYKKIILKELIQKGEVKSYEIFNKILREVGSIKENVFVNAWEVIEDYCLTGGQNTDKGGLPHLPHPSK
jgi:hypothetical protein